MSQPWSYPPPGAAPAPSPPPPHGPGPAHGVTRPGALVAAPTGWSPAPGMLGAAHKPGAVPLRPLRLGDVYDAAFRIIRHNPRATVGAAALVSAVAMTLPVLVTAVVSFTLGAGIDTTATGGAGAGGGSDGDALGLGVGVLSLVAGSVLLQVGLVLVTGMVSGVTHAAALGQRMSLAQAWAQTRGRRWRLVGLMLLTGALGLVVVVVWALTVVVVVLVGSTLAIILYVVFSALLLLVPALLLLGMRLIYLATPVLMLEDVGVLGSVRRAFELSRGQFWRLLGFAVLTSVVSGFAGGILATPIIVVGEITAALTPGYFLLVIAVMQAVSTVVQSSFTAPFKSVVAALLYLDERIRKEAYDVELMSRAGLLGP